MGIITKQIKNMTITKIICYNFAFTSEFNLFDLPKTDTNATTDKNLLIANRQNLRYKTGKSIRNLYFRTFNKHINKYINKYLKL